MCKYKMSFIGLVVSFIFLQGSISQAGIVYEFDDQTQFEADFPSGNMSITGDSGVSLLSSPGRVHLMATNSVASGSRIAIYSTSNAEQDFISEAKTVTFNSLKMETPTSGNTYLSYFGLASEAGVHFPNADDAVYFQLSRGSGNLDLIQQVNGTATTLQTWSAGGFLLSENGRAVTLESLSLTLDGTSWAVEGTIVGEPENTLISGSGSFSTTLSAANWGSDFYLGLQAWQTAKDAARWTSLTVDSVVIPEPATLSLFMLSGVGVMLFRHMTH